MKAITYSNANNTIVHTFEESECRDYELAPKGMSDDDRWAPPKAERNMLWIDYLFDCLMPLPNWGSNKTKLSRPTKILEMNMIFVSALQYVQ